MGLVKTGAALASFGVAWVALGEYFKNELALAHYKLGFIDSLKLTYGQISDDELKEIMEISDEFKPEINLMVFDIDGISDETLTDFATILAQNPKFKVDFSEFIGLDMAFMEPSRKAILNVIKDVASYNENSEEMSFASEFCDGHSEFLAGENFMICEEI